MLSARDSASRAGAGASQTDSGLAAGGWAATPRSARSAAMAT